MHEHTSRIKESIEIEHYDQAWREVHEFQDWCIERINLENHDVKFAGTLLSSPQSFFVEILKSEKKYKLALVHIIYQGVLDGRNLKSYAKDIIGLVKKCNFQITSLDSVICYYDDLKKIGNGINQDYFQINDEVNNWQ